MAKTKIMKRIFLIYLVFSLLAPSSGATIFKWKKAEMDGSRTGVVTAGPDNVDETMGRIVRGKYIAPNGKEFKKNSSTAKVAKLMIDVQPSMAFVKELVGHSAREMKKHSPESELTNWVIDMLMEETGRLTEQNIDLGITNFGGIRVDMPSGDVLYDDLQSMFPFNNTLCCVKLKGSDVRRIFERMASTSVQVVGGVRIVVKDRKLQSILVGGEPLDDNRIYNLATISFLLNGGDGLNLAQNAIEVVDTQVNIFDAVINHVREMTKRGEVIEYEMDGRVQIIGDRRR